MTEEEFREDVQSVGEMYDWCLSNGYENFVDDIWYEDSVYEEINDQMIERARNDMWYEVRDWLNEVPRDSETGYYRRDDYGDFTSIDGYDETDMLDELIYRLREDGVFDNDDEDEESNEEDGEDCVESVMLTSAGSAALKEDSDKRCTVANLIDLPDFSQYWLDV